MSAVLPAPTAATSPGGAGDSPREQPSRRWWDSSRLKTFALYVASIAVGFGLSAALVAATHGSPSKVFTAMFDGSLRNWGSLGYTLDNTAPLLIVAAGTIVTVRAGFFNIGQEGQLTIGAMCAAFVALKVHPSGPLVLVLALVAGAAGGAVWAGIVALLKFWRGVDVVISSLLLIFVAGQVLSYALSTPRFLQERASGATLTESDQLSSKVQLPHFGQYPNFNFGTGLIIALVVALLLGTIATRTTWGYRLKVLGFNPIVARRIGVSAAVFGSAAIVISGACAGLAGSVMLTGQAYRITPTFSNNFGWNGLLVALVARNRPAVAVPVAFFFGALQAGGGFLETTGVPTDLVNIVEALLVLAAVFPPALMALKRYRLKRAEQVSTVATTGAA